MKDGIHWPERPEYRRPFPPDDIGEGQDTDFGAFMRARVEDVLGLEFEVLREVGQGGMAVVFSARRRASGEMVALKVVRADQLKDSETLARFRREAELTLQLSHENVVRTLSVHEVPPRGIALAMELMAGGTLKDRMQTGGQFPVQATIRVLRDVATALGHAHRLGVIHRDVKPDNIFFTEKGWKAKLGDFGIARGQGSETLTMHGTAIGTPAYMSPEQIESGQVGPPSDFYSLGMVGWHMLTGHQPWSGETMAGIVKRQLMDHLPPISSFRADVPEHVVQVLARCMEKDPRGRFQNSKEIERSLITGGVAGTAIEPAPRGANATIRFRPASMTDNALTTLTSRAIRSSWSLIVATVVSVVLLGTFFLLGQGTSGSAVNETPARTGDLAIDQGGSTSRVPARSSPEESQPERNPTSAEERNGNDPSSPAEGSDETETTDPPDRGDSPTWPESRVKREMITLMDEGRYSDAASLVRMRLRGEARERRLREIIDACLADREFSLSHGLPAPTCPAR